ncbi:MAG: RagB/SusD family nutrient uptake outer membrane protein [Cyclobacteriaceae bacterium]|nr:RagB/SusD family nutrient uptake outer membrane protein [Cyclobacteriaceae bacterium]
MKNIIVILAISTLIFSCGEEFLTEEPNFFYAPESIFKNEQSAETVLRGIYITPFELETTGGVQHYQFIDASALDATRHQSLTNSWSEGRWGAGDGDLNRMWNLHYSTITRANSFLEGMALATFSEEIQNQFIAEARALRGNSYFELLKSFGGVPLVLDTKIENTSQPRASAEAVYNQALEDMTWGLNYLPPFSEQLAGRLSSGAVNGLLARVYLYDGDFANARAHAQAVISSGEHSLIQDVAKVFTADHDNMSEWMFDQGALGAFGSTYQAMIMTFPNSLNNQPMMENPSLLYGGGFRIFTVSEYLINLMDQNLDGRYIHWTWNTYVNPLTGKVTALQGGSGTFMKKFYDFNPEAQGSPGNYRLNRIDWPYLRYSDVLLMFAEAENEVNGPTVAAFDALNEVRNRAGLDDITTTELPDPDTFRKEIQDERARELFGEAGLRRYDLIRWGLYMDRVYEVNPGNSEHVETDMLFPIPSGQFDINPNLVQNPGY